MPWILPTVHSTSAHSFPVSSNPANPALPAPETPEPMQLGFMRPSLSSEERLHCRQNNLYLYCGEPGHYVRMCPAKMYMCLSISPGNLSPLSASTNHLALSLLFQLPEGAISVNTIVGPCSYFIDLTFAVQQCISLQPKIQELPVYLADGSWIKSGMVTQETPPLSVYLTKHRELFKSLNAITSRLFPVILGLPWLQAHNP